ncbi:ExbD/TolR family protein [Neisseria sp. Ec49-e6-T10]|uniref:ExbD/TolR family protein n=1 Tax=Neisseria sp. Ec49-e6-T10 TaxID=3140744 RepID=UPI003EC09B93
MKFRRHRHYEPPEINFIPLIDVLLVILIFLMVTTTYSRFSQIDIKLPVATTNKEENQTERPEPVFIAIAESGDLMVGNISVPKHNPQALANTLNQIIPEQNKGKTVVVINADANTSHQNVIKVMEVARDIGLTQLTFATQNK